MALRDILDRNRLQQKDVAEGIEVSRVTVWNWVSGRATPTGTNQAKLLAFLRQYEPTLDVTDLAGEPALDLIEAEAAADPAPDAA